LLSPLHPHLNPPPSRGRNKRKVNPSIKREEMSELIHSSRGWKIRIVNLPLKEEENRKELIFTLRKRKI